MAPEGCDALFLLVPLAAEPSIDTEERRENKQRAQARLAALDAKDAADAADATAVGRDLLEKLVSAGQGHLTAGSPTAAGLARLARRAATAALGGSGLGAVHVWVYNAATGLRHGQSVRGGRPAALLLLDPWSGTQRVPRRANRSCVHALEILDASDATLSTHARAESGWDTCALLLPDCG